MLRSRFFWRLFGSYAVLVLLTTLVVAFFVGRYVEGRQQSAQVESLRRQCVLLSPYAHRDFEHSDGALTQAIQDQVNALAETNGIRITFIQRDGLVVLDTEEEPSTMDNHRGRPEIQEALVTGMGISWRFGQTLGVDALYVAYVQDASSTDNGVVRVSVPAADSAASTAQVLARTAPGASLAALLALILGYLGARRLTAPLKEMTDAAKAFKEGNYDQRIHDLPHNELGELGDALNQLGGEVRTRVDRLSEERGRLSAILAGMAESVIAVDESDRIAFSNLAADRLFGSLQEAGGQKARLWQSVPLPGLVELVEQARQDAAGAQRELVFAHSGGERRLVAKAQRFDNQKALGVVVVFDDITELRQLERVRQDFVANVSHELKTPLTSIRGYVETLIEGALHDEEHNMRFLGKIHKNVDRLNALVSDLLSLARIENQEGRLVRQPVDLTRVIADSVVRFEEEAKRASITLSSNAPEGPCLAWGDEQALEQVFVNLISNALKYTSEGGQVTLHLEQASADEVHIQVSDTGVGIPVADQDRIFERFYRVDKARSQDLGGTGLGLSIVKHHVQAMLGRVGVESEPGKGTTFHVHLESAPAQGTA